MMAAGDVTERSRLLDHPDGQRAGEGDANRREQDGELGLKPGWKVTVSAVEEISMRELVAIMVVVWVGVFVAALDSTITATLTVPISSEFNSLSLLSWLATAYLIANTATQPLAGKLTDIFSRRNGLIYSNIFFGAGCLICGLAKDEYVMIAGRVVSGIGGGGLIVIASILTSDLVPLRRRGVWQGFVNVVYGAGMSLGGFIGGWINDTLGWRWAFLLQVPLAFASGLLVTFFIKLPVKETGRSAWKRVDYGGALLLTLSLVLFLFGINTGGNQLPWSHPLVLTVLPLSALLLGLFIYVEDQIALEPIIPVRLLLRRTVWAGCWSNAFCTMSLYTIYFYMPFYLQVTGASATKAGLRMIPQGIAASLGSTGTGLMMRETGRYKFLTSANAALFAIGVGLICTLDFSSEEWRSYAYLIPLGAGCAGVLTITPVALIAAVDHKDQAVITSASYAFRSAGSTVGVTVASAVFQNRLNHGLLKAFDGVPHKASIIGRIRDDFHTIADLPSLVLQIRAFDSYLAAFRSSFYAALGMAVVAGLLGLLMREHKLHATLART